MTKPNPHLWPNGSCITISDRGGEIAESSDRRFDLADAIMLGSKTSQRTVDISISFKSEPGEDISSRLEAMIRDDLRFDGYGVTLTRLEPIDFRSSYRWSVRVRTL